jgi:CRISPR-associated protein (TIGR03986 family)
MRQSILHSEYAAMFAKNFFWIFFDSIFKPEDMKQGQQPTLKPKHIRQRATYTWTDHHKKCSKKDLCPLCELIGRFDRAGKRARKKDGGFHFHFGNFLLPQRFGFEKETDIAQNRLLNRIDFNSGKAHDFFDIYEIDFRKFPVFFGEITMDQSVSQASIKLLDSSLRLIDHLCGALCIITGQKKTGISPKKNLDDSAIDNRINDAFDTIIAILEKEHKTEYKRILAESIRKLSGYPDQAMHLPQSPEQEDHYFWDLTKDAVSIRDILQENARSNQWRTFCEKLGNQLYLSSKESESSIQPPRRILGDSANYGQTEQVERTIAVSSKPALKEFVLYGTLKALTPFFFGVEENTTRHSDHAEKPKNLHQSELVDLQVLLTPDKNYRLPRSALRGILRRDLQIALNTRCLARLGGRPCTCEVCRIMRCVTLMDARSDNNRPPEIRHRIRINPFTGTVAESALFTMEVAPENLSFPFVLRYQSAQDFPQALNQVLKWWHQGYAFMSGAASTGKGRFKLCQLNSHCLSFSDDYFKACGWRKLQQVASIVKEKHVFNVKKEKQFPWKPIHIKIYLSSPFINGDPILAMIKGSGANVVSFQKYVDDDQPDVFAYKSESFKGLLRAAVGRIPYDNQPLNELTHNDCDCVLCQLFGSKHEIGNLRVEDLTFTKRPATMPLDHVAIDRFTGGGVAHKKFKDAPVYPDGDNEFVLEGCFWIRPDQLDHDAFAALSRAFADIVNGSYPLGGKTGMGYGQIQKITLDWDSELNWQIPMELLPEKHSPYTKIEKQICYQKPEIEPDKYYYPHYFLPHHSTVNRDKQAVSHHQFAPNLLTGKISCRLTTKTPLIIPDTSNDNAFDLIDDAQKLQKKRHQSYHFFSMNGAWMIPGSELRGMISSVYEAITNSCYRIFDAQHRLSWRMAPDEKDEQAENQHSDNDNKKKDLFVPGRVTDDGRIEEMEAYRYPFYDSSLAGKREQEQFFQWDQNKETHCGWTRKLIITSETIDNIQNEFDNRLVQFLKQHYMGQEFSYTDKLYSKLREDKEILESYHAKLGRVMALLIQYGEGHVPKYNHPTDSDRMIMKLAGFNRRHAHEKEQKQYKGIKADKNPHAVLATCADNPDLSLKAEEAFHGYLKVTGPNKLDKEVISEEKIQIVDCSNDNQIVLDQIMLQKEYVSEAKYAKDRDRLKPVYIYQENKDGKTHEYKMTKRCERVFKKKDGGQTFFITEQARSLFKILVDTYNENAEHYEIPPQFRTILPENGVLNPGDLIYFRKEIIGTKTQCAEIIPVKISRRVDRTPIGKRLDKALRPCHGEWLEEKDISTMNPYREKRLLTRHPEGLCPACRLFGTGAYKGRVRFGFAQLQNPPVWANPNDNHSVMLPVLERPRPTFSMPKPVENNWFSRKVPGRKFYVHHFAYKDILAGKQPGTGEEIKQSKNNRTVMPLDANNTFTFDIHFENLHEHELGLLIYTLQLEKNLAHKLGMAKSMGFGSVEIDLEHIGIRKDSQTYENANHYVHEWIKKGMDHLTHWYGHKYDILNQLKKLLYFPEKRNIKVFYPPLVKNENAEFSYQNLQTFKPDKLDNRIQTLSTPGNQYLRKVDLI